MNSEQQASNKSPKANLNSFLRNWWQNMLFGTKLIIGISCIFGFINLFTNFCFELFVNSPQQTIPFQIQRLFFSQFIHYYTLDLLLAIICLYQKLEVLEKDHSTSFFIILMLLVGILTQLMSVLLQFVISYVYSPIYSSQAYGLWNYYVFCVVFECSSSPPNGQSLFLLFPIQIKNQFYPTILIIFLTLIQQSLGFVSAAFMAIIFYKLQYQLIRFSLYHSKIFFKIEKCFLFKLFSDRSDFHKLGGPKQTEPSDYERELQSVETPPAKLTLQDNPQQSKSDLILTDLEKEMNQIENESKQPIKDNDEEQKQDESSPSKQYG